MASTVKFSFRPNAIDGTRLGELIADSDCSRLEVYKHAYQCYFTGLYSAKHNDLLKRIWSELDFNQFFVAVFSDLRIVYDENYWLNDSDVVAALLVPEWPDFGRDKSHEIWSTVCGGELPSGAVVNLSKPFTKKKFGIYQSGFDHYFSPDTIELMNLTGAEFCETTVAGEAHHWKRLLSQSIETCDFIDPYWSTDTSRTAKHAACGEDYRIDYEFWISNGDDLLSQPIVRSEARFGHIPHESHFIVSVDMAKKLIRKRADLYFQPIYARNCELVAKHIEFLSHVRNEFQT